MIFKIFLNFIAYNPKKKQIMLVMKVDKTVITLKRISGLCQVNSVSIEEEDPFLQSLVFNNIF